MEVLVLAANSIFIQLQIRSGISGKSFNNPEYVTVSPLQQSQQLESTFLRAQPDLVLSYGSTGDGKGRGRGKPSPELNQ
jgi:hypothetical protein